MKNISSVIFEWQEIDEGQELPPITAPDQAPRVYYPDLERRLFLGSAALLLAAALLVSSWVMRYAQRELTHVSSELAVAVETEDSTARKAMALPSESREYTVTDQSHEQVISVEVQARRPDVAAVLVVTQASLVTGASPTTYRQLRFYQRTDEGWQPTEPVPDLWGQEQRLATAHFDVTYRSRDAQAVQALAAELDTLYAQMRNNLGLPPASDAKVAITVVAEATSDSRAQPDHQQQHQQIIVSSPALLRAPDSLADSAILRHSVLLHLVDRVMQEAVSTYWIPPRWYDLLDAMHIWQMWNLDGSSATTQEPMLGRLVNHLKGLVGDSVPPPAAEHTELCALYGLWEIAPVHRALPLSCGDFHQATATSPALSVEHGSAPLRDVIQLSSYQFHLTEPVLEAKYGGQRHAPTPSELVLIAALLEYIAASFGHEHISALWSILHEHDDWETIIPAVFGVSVDEFETGWQAYMANMFDQ